MSARPSQFHGLQRGRDCRSRRRSGTLSGDVFLPVSGPPYRSSVPYPARTPQSVKEVPGSCDPIQQGFISFSCFFFLQSPSRSLPLRLFSHSAWSAGLFSRRSLLCGQNPLFCFSVTRSELCFSRTFHACLRAGHLHARFFWFGPVSSPVPQQASAVFSPVRCPAQTQNKPARFVEDKQQYSRSPSFSKRL